MKDRLKPPVTPSGGQKNYAFSMPNSPIQEMIEARKKRVYLYTPDFTARSVCAEQLKKTQSVLLGQRKKDEMTLE